tara:strand:+ start:523 stop:867 length:345 start_codon:yes stop_codon:yes gene_type:complete
MTKDIIVEKLKTCFDPEIPIDLWNLGLIYDIKIFNLPNGNFSTNILMTLTTPGCNMAEYIANDVKEKLLSIKDIENVNVEITFSPSWDPSRMTKEAKEKLGLGLDNNNDDESWE